MSGWRLSLGLLLALVACAHLGALGGGWVWDDRQVLRVGPADIGASWEARPLRQLTIAWDIWAWGGSPAGMRLTNLVLHGASAAGVWALARAFGLSWQGALVAGAAYGVHPILCEVVSSVANRKESLLVLATVLCVLSFLRSEGKGPWRFASLLFFALAALAKETAVAIPALLLLSDRVRRGTWRGIRWGAHLPFWGLAAAAAWVFLLRLWATRPGDRVVRIDLAGYSGTELLSAAGEGFWRSVSLLAFPTGLSADHPMPPGGGAGLAGAAFLALTLAAALFWTTLRAGRAGSWTLPTAWLWMAAAWFPTTVLVSAASFPVAERYWALPLAGAALALGRLSDFLAGRFRQAEIPFYALFFLWVVASSRGDRRWRDDHALATAAIVENPRSWMGRIDRAHREARVPGRRALADAQFDRAAALEPRAGHVDFFRGRLDLAEGRFASAGERLAAAYRKGFVSEELFACGVDAAVRTGDGGKAAAWLDQARRAGVDPASLAARLSRLRASWEKDGVAGGGAAAEVARWEAEISGNGKK